MDVCIQSGALGGTVAAIPSKSDAHRKLICAALADRPTELSLPSSSADIDVTAQCLRSLGAHIVHQGEAMTVTPVSTAPLHPLLDCGESGSTLRFLLPVAAARCESAWFAGQGRLPERPIGHLRQAMEAHGVVFSADRLPFATTGQLTGGDYLLPGDVSSQYITGLLLALPQLPGDSTLTLTTPLQSAGYVDITLGALERFGVRIHKTPTGWLIPGRQIFRSPGRMGVDGDWSNAAFFLAAGALGQGVTVTGLDTDSPQGDKAVVNILRQFGAAVTTAGNSVTVGPGALRGCTVDVGEIPDALPILAVLASAAHGETRFVNAARLRLKESDRLTTTAAMLRDLGGEVEEFSDGLLVRGGCPLHGGTVDGANDHRIVMAAAIAAASAAAPVTITDAEAVRKSYPDFFKDFQRLGGNTHGL